MKSIVTISRQFGSGGHTIGKLAAERLGFPFYDQEIIERVMERTGLSGEYIQETGEYLSLIHIYKWNCQSVRQRRKKAVCLMEQY